MKKNSPIVKSIKHIRGAALVMVAGILIAILALASLCIDLGNIFLVQSQLQNASDATALYGGAYLYPSTSSGAPNWSLAQSEAKKGLTLNQIEGVALSNVTTVPGYWNFNTSSMESTNITPGPNNAPALQVTVSKSAGVNGGPVSLLLGAVVGIKTVNLSATSVAVAGSPSTVTAGTLFPLALSMETYNDYWDSSTNSPKMNSLTRSAFTLQINEGGTQGCCTCFKSPTNDTDKMIGYMSTGNPTSLSIGDSIWMTSNLNPEVYSACPVNKTCMIPICQSCDQGSQQQIVAFGCCHIDNGYGYGIGGHHGLGNGKYIQLQLTNNFKYPTGPTGGPTYGVYMPPRLVK